jgi:hypothetical protein
MSLLRKLRLSSFMPIKIHMACKTFGLCNVATILCNKLECRNTEYYLILWSRFQIYTAREESNDGKVTIKSINK